MDDLEHIKREQKRIEDSVLDKFAEKWGRRDGYRRFKILQEAISKINSSLTDPESKVIDKSIHPEHMEIYVAHLVPRVRALLENCGEKVIKMFEKAPTHDARVAMIIKCVNIIDEKAEALEAQRKAAESKPETPS